MSDELDLIGKTSVVVGEEEEMNEFYQRLIKLQLQNQSPIQLQHCCAGSLSEIYGQPWMFNQYGLNKDLTDTDNMTYRTDTLAISFSQTVPEQFSGKVVRISSDSRHAGYVTLLDEKTGKALRRDKQIVFRTKVGDIHGPATKYITENNRKGSKLCERVSDDDWLAICRGATTVTDFVFAVHSPYWPIVANEWVTRSRPHGLPSISTIKEVVRRGCDFVQVSHDRNNTDDTEWRFSFSRAETIIINYWTTSQRIVYRTLHMLCKIIKSKMDRSVLCTYYFKTLMLWATEEKPKDFWLEDVLFDSVCELLFQLVNWLKLKSCRNYFIRNNNMLDDFTETDLCKDINRLYVFGLLLHNTEVLVDLLQSARFAELRDCRMKFYIDAPISVYTSLIIFEQFKTNDDRDTRLFSKSFPKLVHHAYYCQLSELYQGLKIADRAENSVYSNEQNLFLKSRPIEHLTRRTISAEGRHSSLLCSRNMATSFLPSWFIKYEPGSSKSLSDATHETIAAASKLNLLAFDKHRVADCKYLLYSRSMDDFLMLHDHFNDQLCNNETIIVLYITTELDKKAQTNVEFYKVSPHLSPTVNISWFINKMYLANFCYTIQQDYNATDEICEEIIQVITNSFCNEAFAGTTFSMILSTEWTSVYDEELQAMLGLYSLCTFMFNKIDRSRPVCLGVSPAVFAMYLKLLCRDDQVILEMLDKCEYDQKFRECWSNIKGFNGNFTLYSALKVRAQL